MSKNNYPPKPANNRPKMPEYGRVHFIDPDQLPLFPTPASKAGDIVRDLGDIVVVRTSKGGLCFSEVIEQ